MPLDNLAGPTEGRAQRVLRQREQVEAVKVRLRVRCPRYNLQTLLAFLRRSTSQEFEVQTSSSDSVLLFKLKVGHALNSRT